MGFFKVDQEVTGPLPIIGTLNLRIDRLEHLTEHLLRNGRSVEHLRERLIASIELQESYNALRVRTLAELCDPVLCSRVHVVHVLEQSGWEGYAILRRTPDAHVVELFDLLQRLVIWIHQTSQLLQVSQRKIKPEVCSERVSSPHKSLEVVCVEVFNDIVCILDHFYLVIELMIGQRSIHVDLGDLCLNAIMIL